MKYTNSIVVLAVAGIGSLWGFARGESSSANEVEPELVEPVRQLIRGRSSIPLEDNDVPNERDLTRTRRNGGGNGGNGGSKGSKSGGSKGSKGGSKGSKGGSSSSFSGGFDGDKGTCGAFCGDKDFAYIHLDGSYFFGEFNDNSTDTVPIETVGALNTTKEGGTLRIFEDDLRGTAKYFDHYDKYPYKSDISGVITGSCTVLATFPGNSSGVQFSEDCLAHCTICVSYTGLCCDSHGYGWDKEENCTSFGGFATVTGDLLFGVEQRIGVNGRLQSIPLTEGGLVSLDGFGAITGTAGELGPASNGGLAIIEYDAFSSDGDTYSIGLKVPFNDGASCKLQETVLGGFGPPSSPQGPPSGPIPTRPPPIPTGTIEGTVSDNLGNRLSDVTIELRRPGGLLVSTTITNSNGFYKFPNVQPGDYILVEIDLPGYASVSDNDVTPEDVADGSPVVDNIIAVTVLPGETDSGNNFVDRLLGGIAGRVTAQGDTPIPLRNVLMTLYNVGDVGGSVVATTTTDGSGDYEFTNLLPGDYVVVETNPVEYPISISDFDTKDDGDPEDGIDVGNGDDMIPVKLDEGELLDDGNDFVDAASEEVPVPCAGVIITEILYDPTAANGGDNDGEWVEILNHGCLAVDMTNWKVGDSDRRGVMSAGDGGSMTLQPNEYAIIIDKNARDMSPAVNSTVQSLIDGGTRVFLSPFTFIGNRLVNDGTSIGDPGAVDMGDDLVVLSDANGMVVDRVEFGSTCGASQGASLERQDPFGPGDCSNFVSSTGNGPTPGVENNAWTGQPISTPCTCIPTPPPPTPPCIIITEILKTPAGGDSEKDKEWVEIYNNGCDDANLTGWAIGDTSLTNGLLPIYNNGTLTLVPGGSVVLYPTASGLMFSDGVNSWPIDGTRFGSNLNDGDDKIILYDNFGNEVDSVNYQCDNTKTLENCDGEPGPGETLARQNSSDNTSFKKSQPTPGEQVTGFNAVTCEVCPPKLPPPS